MRQRCAHWVPWDAPLPEIARDVERMSRLDSPAWRASWRTYACDGRYQHFVERTAAAEAAAGAVQGELFA